MQKRTYKKRSASTKDSTTSQQKISVFGPLYTQFKGRPVAAIKYLKKQKKGEAVDALYRQDLGYINIVWGNHNTKTNNGKGLCHIIAKHEKQIQEHGYKIEDFIPIVVQFGDINEKKSDKNKKVYESEMFRFVIAIDHKRKNKWLLTAFDLRKKLNPTD